jgi:hypothetical protein
VFYDRLTDNKDRHWLYNRLRHCVRENFKENFDLSLDTLPLESGMVSQPQNMYINCVFVGDLEPGLKFSKQEYPTLSFQLLNKCTSYSCIMCYINKGKKLEFEGASPPSQVACSFDAAVMIIV